MNSQSTKIQMLERALGKSIKEYENERMFGPQENRAAVGQVAWDVLGYFLLFLIACIIAFAIFRFVKKRKEGYYPIQKEVQKYGGQVCPAPNHARAKSSVDERVKELYGASADKKKANTGNKYVRKFIKLTFGFLLGTLAYAIGFVLAGSLFDLSNLFVILPATIDLQQASLTASSLGANFIGCAAFRAIDNNEYHGIAFCIWQIIIAAFHLVSCLIWADYHLIWYAISSFVLNGISIKTIIQDIAKGANE